MISMTDNLGKTVVSSSESYKKAVMNHAAKDEEITDKVLNEIKAKVDRHMQMLRRVTGMGEEHVPQKQVGFNQSFRWA